MNKEIKKLIHDIGLKYGIPDEEVKNIVFSPYQFANEKLKEANEKINKANTPQDVEDLKKVFLFKSLCKLYICNYRMKNLIKKRKNNVRRN